MAVHHDPIAKQCREFGISPAVLGYDKKTTTRNPGAQTRKKYSEYGAQLKEKQKLKFVYGVLENQFEHYYEMAEKQKGIAGENLIKILESRLDNIVFRMGYAKTRKEARQLVRHAHFTLNGKKADIPSIILKVGDVVALKDKSRSSEKIKGLMEAMASANTPKWLEVNVEAASAKVIAIPARDDVDFPFNEQLIVEFYSK